MGVAVVEPKNEEDAAQEGETTGQASPVESEANDVAYSTSEDIIEQK